MKLQHIDLSNLRLSEINVRRHGARDLESLIASIRSLGVIQPLLVRPNCDGFEVVAGQRRLLACQALAEEQGRFDPLPCAVLEEGDDAKAIEASLAENVMRLPMDELDQYAAFSAMLKQGRSVEEIAEDFGVSQQLVHRRLAIANLYPPILNAYRRDEIDVASLRTLTMATKSQQKAWFKRFKDPKDRAPTGRSLKHWLFGGASIEVSAALFPEEDYTGSIVTDLFGEERYFDDPVKFWTCQNKAIAEAQARYLEEGWSEVVVLDIGLPFRAYEMVERSKKKGGRVYIACACNGEVTFHEGYITEKEVRKLDRAESKGEAPAAKPELTKAGQRYCSLHRHNAVRMALLKSPHIALRLIAAHAIAQGPLWEVRPENQDCFRNESIRASIEASKAEKAFDKERQAVRDLLGFEESEGFLMRPSWEPKDIDQLFARLLELDDKAVLRILTFVMAESLQAGGTMVEALGHILKVEMADWWQPDEAFFELLRDKPAINAMLAEVGGKAVAEGNVTATAKVQKQVLQDCLEGRASRKKPEAWLPRYMAFPMRGYTDRGGLGAVECWKAIRKLFTTKS